MSTTIQFLILLLLNVGWAMTIARADAAEPLAPPKLSPHSCATGDRARTLKEPSPSWESALDKFGSRNTPSVIIFSDALSLRKSARTPQKKALAEFWIAYSLERGEMPHLAHAGYSSLISQPVSDEIAPIQFEALLCLRQIQDRYPSISIPLSVRARVGELAMHPAVKQDDSDRMGISDLSLRLILQGERIGDAVLAKMPQHHALARAIAAAQSGKHDQAAKDLERFFEKSVPDSMENYVDHAHLLLARSYYSTGRFDQAGAQLRLVRKSSNELAHSLSELAWAMLLADRQGDAIGAAISVQAGGLRHAFTPEAPMVMAMALNELCQYPDSLKAIQNFKRTYDAPYKWLESWQQQGYPALYSQAVKFIKKQPGVPDRIGTEWVRSPIVVSHQEEINLLFAERDSLKSLGLQGAREQVRMANAIVSFARELSPRIRTFRLKNPGDAPLSAALKADLSKMRSMLGDYRRLSQAAPSWKAVSASFQKRVPVMERTLVKQINAELDRRTKVMLGQLQEIAENNQLIEVEIYNGASNDIVWKNAHPDYAKVSQELTERKTNPEGVWDWGRTSADMDENAEVWEDELGSFKADMVDNCSSKDKYLHLKKLSASR